jgi:diguanylate cyclase (GGDEF)-like protein
MIRVMSLGHTENQQNLGLHEALHGLSSILRMEDLVEALKEHLPRLGIPSFIISRYGAEWIHAPRLPWEIPERQVLVGGVLEGADIAVPAEAAYSARRIFPPGLAEGRERRTFAVYPLFFRETHYGTIAYEITHTNGTVYESLTTQISGVVKTIALFRGKEEAEERLKRAMSELEGFNRQLSRLSLTDELTGLYNRRGFIQLAAQALDLSRQMGKKALLVYGDLDGLKSINDNFGHQAGDEAIKDLASILRRTFRSIDILARLGGDEFTVLVPHAEEDHARLFASRIAEYTIEANSKPDRGYRLSVSLGWVVCANDAARSLEEYMREADKSLYEQKKAKKKRATGG